MNPGGLSTAMINTRGLNGEHAWSGMSGGGGGMVFRMAGPGGQQLLRNRWKRAAKNLQRRILTLSARNDLDASSVACS